MSPIRVSSQDLYRLFFEEASDALLAVSLPDGNLHVVNNAFSHLTGYSREEIEGEFLSALVSQLPADYERERRLDLAMVQSPGQYNDVALGTRDHQVKFVSVKVRHVQLRGKTLALVVLQDETERQLLMRDLAAKHQSLETAYIELEKYHTELKSTQEKVFQVSKLVALGELAAGMSHELNQPLTGIKGFAQEIGDLLKSSAKPSKKEILSLSEEIVKNSDKMASLLSHLRNFARRDRASLEPNEEKTKSVLLNESFKNVSVLLARQLQKHDIQLIAKGMDEAVWVEGLPHPIEQVLINLITNSRDAILEKVQTQSGFKGKISVEVSSKTKGTVELRVWDNGPGIPTKVAEKIFDPFFSTKEQGKGMGLGLSISFGIMHRFGGELSLESSSPSGTCFLATFKAAKGQNDVQRKAA